jgi:hypothetical protein
MAKKCRSWSQGGSSTLAGLAWYPRSLRPLAHRAGAKSRNPSNPRATIFPVSGRADGSGSSAVGRTVPSAVTCQRLASRVPS